MLMALVSACGTGVKVPRSTFRRMPKDATFVVEARSGQMSERTMSLGTIAQLLALDAEMNDRVLLRTDSSGTLFVELTGSNATEVYAFTGSHARRGYLEIFLANDVKEIPPFLPIIYSRRNIDRLRLALTNGDQLVIDHKWAKDGNIFLLSGGGSGRVQYSFRVAR